MKRILAPHETPDVPRFGSKVDTSRQCPVRDDLYPK